jgi:hypothetical protein
MVVVVVVVVVAAAAAVVVVVAAAAAAVVAVVVVVVVNSDCSLTEVLLIFIPQPLQSHNIPPSLPIHIPSCQWLVDGCPALTDAFFPL